MDLSNIQTMLFSGMETYGMKILTIALVFVFSRLILTKTVGQIVKFSNGDAESKRTTAQKRARTLAHLIETTGGAVILIIILLMILNDLFSIDTKPLLAGVGIIGLAIGFGAQSLVKDFMSGLFILIEGQYNIGDRVKLGAFEGTVSKITIRSTILKDDDENIYYIPNGSINNVINLSQGKH
jgi:small conductance mechanosensitive channel